MIITLSPMAGSKTTNSFINGLVITVDGIDYDLSAIPDGGQAEAGENSPFIGIVTRESVTILYEYDSKLAEPNQSADWADYTFDIESGAVPSPIRWRAAN